MNKNQKFVVSHLDKQSGPFDEKELRGKWEKGELLPIDYVYHEEKHDWVLIAELFPWASTKREAPKSEPTPPPVTETAKRKTTPKVEFALPKVEPILSQPEKKAEPVREFGPAVDLVQPEPTKVEKPMMEVTSVTTVTGADLVPAPAPTPAPAALTPVLSIGTKVQLSNGVGELDLNSLQPGFVELCLQGSSTSLTLNEPFHIHVKPAEPVELKWNLVQTQTVGENLSLVVRALDDKGQVCIGHNDHYVLQIRGSMSQDMNIQMKDGQATLNFNHVKAEKWTFSVYNPHQRQLRLPEAHTLEWAPGVATRLILDGPREYTAGAPLKVRVKAVDNFGNLANTFQGTVVLEVKAS